MPLEKRWIYLVLMLTLVPVAASAETSLYIKGPAIGLGIGGNVLRGNYPSQEILDSADPAPPVVPRLSVRLGWGVNERRLYYIESSLAYPDLGTRLGSMFFPANYDKVYIFGDIGAAVLPVPAALVDDDPELRYASWLPLLGTSTSLFIRGGIGYQWARYSTIEFGLMSGAIWGHPEGKKPYRFVGASITLQGIPW